MCALSRTTDHWQGGQPGSGAGDITVVHGWSGDDQNAAQSRSGYPARVVAFTFAVLFAMNMLDYLDRNILSAVLPQIRADLEIAPAAAGLLPTFFLVTFSLVGLVMGFAADRLRRTYLLGLGVAVWSLATVASGLAQNYWQLVVARSFLGIGEATYGVIAPTLLLDLFPRHQRARAMSGFYLAMPIGSALGIALGGQLAVWLGWQAAFFVVGAPGLIAAVLALWLPEPVRGASEGVDPTQLLAHEKERPTKADYQDLMVNSSYTYAVFGMTAYTFAIGALVLWVPSYLTTARGMPHGQATLVLGGVTLLAALIGMSLGGWVSDRLGRTDPRMLFIVPGLAMLAAVPFVLVGLLSTKPLFIFLGIFLAEALMFVNTGPCNAIIGNVVDPRLRATAYAAAILTLHFLGDLWSPWLVGWVAETFGKPDTMATSVGQLLARLGAVPVVPQGQTAPENLVAGLLIVVPAILLSGIVLLAGARHLPREMAHMTAMLRARRARATEATGIAEGTPGETPE